MRLACLYWFTFLVLLLSGCSNDLTEVKGRIVSYDYVDLGRQVLSYSTSDDLRPILKEFRTGIGATGSFRFTTRPPRGFPYHVIVNGFVASPMLSVAGFGYVPVDRKTGGSIDLGVLYFYNSVRISEHLKAARELKTLSLAWDCDIPDVDSYKIRLLEWKDGAAGPSTALSVSGIRGKKFSFSEVIGSTIVIGRHRVNDLEVEVNSNHLDGAYLLKVDAIRLINDIPVEITNSVSFALKVVKVDSERGK